MHSTRFQCASCHPVLIAIALTFGCQQAVTYPTDGPLAPSLDRDWSPPMAVLSRAEFHGDQVRVLNVRNFRYAAGDVFVPDYDDRVYDLRDLQTVDFIVVPFPRLPHLAHTMISFGFRGGEHLAVSVEARREKGEEYSPIRGAMRHYELMYVVADERDVIPLRSQHHQLDLYVYPSKASPEQARALFEDVFRRVNQLAERPEFYHTLTNNCTTNIMNHINQLSPNRVRYGWQVLLNGHSDRLAYDLGLLDTQLSFDDSKRQAWVNDRVRYLALDENYSTAMRR